MFEKGRLLKFSPFHFKNGASPKPKYYLVLGVYQDEIIIASLPTSKDHIPANLSQNYGCINDHERNVNAFVFKEKELVTSNFSFPRRTYVYAEQVDEYSLDYLKDMDSVIEDLGLLDNKIFESLKQCLTESTMLKRRFRKMLTT